MKEFSVRAFLVLSVAVLGVSLLSASGAAQEKSSDSAQASASQGQTVAGELAEESREAAGEDKNEALKTSASVRFLSKITGLDVHKSYWLAVILNFAIIAGLVLWAARKNLPGLFQNRTASIQKAMEEARTLSADANRRLADIESRLSKLDVEIGTMQANAEKEVQAEEQRIVEATKEETRKIVETAEQEIASAVKIARRDLKAYAADLAVTIAGKQIKVDAATDKSLVERFAQQLTGNGGRKDS